MNKRFEVALTLESGNGEKWSADLGPFTWLQIQQKPQNTVTKCLPPQQSRIKYQNPQRSETHIIIFLSLFAHLQTSTLTVRETHTNRRITTQPQNDEVGADMPSSYLQKLDLGAVIFSRSSPSSFSPRCHHHQQKEGRRKEAECTRDQKDVRAVQEREKEPDSPG